MSSQSHLFGVPRNENGAIIDYKTGKRCCYLDSAGRSILPLSVLQQGEQGLRCKLSPWQGMGPDDVSNVIRHRFAKLIGADANSIAITPSTGFAMTLASTNISKDASLKPGDSVVVLGGQMASNVLPWQQLCSQTDMHLKVVPNPADGNWTAALLSAIDNRVRVVAIPNVHWGTGVVLDVVAIRAKLRSFHANSNASSYFIIDGTQSIGARRFDVAEVEPDFVACSVHKWLCGAYGTSLVYVNPKFHSQWQPLDQHERSRLGSDDVTGWDEVGVMTQHGFPTKFMSGAIRFDSGGRPNPILLPMLSESLRLVLAWTPDEVERHGSVLAKRLEQQTSHYNSHHGSSKDAHLTLSTNHSSHIVGLHLPSSCDPSAIGRALKQRGIHLSVRAGVLRISFFLYNVPEDVDFLVENLTDLIESHENRSKL